MKVIICLDDNQGMLFNKRRQSKDVKVIEDLATLTNKVWISPFSQKLFEGMSFEEQLQTTVDEMFLCKAKVCEYCFVENENLLPHVDNIEQLVVYKWNRKYPSDFKLDLNLQNWKLIETIDFVGNSHEKITRETYEKY